MDIHNNVMDAPDDDYETVGLLLGSEWQFTTDDDERHMFEIAKIVSGEEINMGETTRYPELRLEYMSDHGTEEIRLGSFEKKMDRLDIEPANEVARNAVRSDIV